jgi:PadR family transcriptional regulator
MTEPRLDVLQGTLDVLVLRALSNGPQHGYAIARFIRDSSDQRFQILDGALYTSLHRMEERGWLTSDWANARSGKRAKFYRLTASGLRARKQRAAAWDRYAAAVASVLGSTPDKA